MDRPEPNWSPENLGRMEAIAAGFRDWLHALPAHWKPGKRMDEVCPPDTLARIARLQEGSAHTPETFADWMDAVYVDGARGLGTFKREQAAAVNGAKAIKVYRANFEAEAKRQINAYQKAGGRRPSRNSVAWAIYPNGNADGRGSRDHANELARRAFTADEIVSLGLADPRPVKARPNAATPKRRKRKCSALPDQFV